jgi:hypothetical protein
MSREDYYSSVLNSIFHSRDPNPVRRDANNPADSAYFNAQSGIRKQAYANWMNSGGEHLVEHLENELIDMVKAFVGTPVNDKSPYLQQKIWSHIDHIDTIHQAFIEQEKQEL